MSTAAHVPVHFHMDISPILTYLLWLAGRHFDRTFLLRRVRGQLRDVAGPRFGHGPDVRSGDSSWPIVSLVVPATHLEGRDKQQHPEGHGVGPDQPDQREYAHPREHREEQSQEHREYAPQDKGPFPPYLLAEPYGGGYLRKPGDDGPGRHQVEQGDRGQAGDNQGDQTRQDAHYSFDEQQPARRTAPGASEHANYREHAIHQGISSEQQDQGFQRDARSQESCQAEKYGDNPP